MIKPPEERLSRINLADFEKVLAEDGKPRDYDTFKKIVENYSDGSRRFYRLNSGRERRRIVGVKDGKIQVVTEDELRALVVYHPLRIDEGKLPIDSYFEIWFAYNLGIDRPMSVGLDVSVLRMDEKPEWSAGVQSFRDGIRTVEQWNKDRIIGLERDKLRGFSACRRDDARVSTYRAFSMDHSIEESQDYRVNRLLYEIFEGMRSPKTHAVTQ